MPVAPPSPASSEGSVEAHTTARCRKLETELADVLADATYVESQDLTTNGGGTTPPDNSLAGLPPGALVPTTDREVIAPAKGDRTPISKAVRGIQINGRIADDATGQARFLLRLPDDWNGRLVVAGASGTRSEFNGDLAWSDYVVQKGYAYASQNKGMLNVRLATHEDPLACRLSPESTIWLRFYANDDGLPFTRWAEIMAKATRIARWGVRAHYGRSPERTYAVGTSNGGYQVRRAVESYPELFDGGVDWEGTFVDADAPNLLTHLPPAILNFPDYRASGLDATSTAALNIALAGYPPDLVHDAGGTRTSYWEHHWSTYWEVTLAHWQKRLDPAYDTYGAGPGAYSYVARRSASDVAAQLAAFATTGCIQRPLVTVAGTMDALLPIDHHARAYARNVERAVGARGPAYRLYEVQNGGHIDGVAARFPELEIVERHARRAFDLLVAHVEKGLSLPPNQAIPRGGDISAHPERPGHCAKLLE